MGPGLEGALAPQAMETTAHSFGIVLPLWSYAADDGRLLDHVAGEVGLDHVTVPVVTGVQTQFRLAEGCEQPHFRTEGGWHFPPTAKLYTASGVRPTKARWFGAADHLARLREHTNRLGARLVLRIDIRAVQSLVEQEPLLGQRNAWGQEIPSAGACACNPHARELLRATLEDLRRYEPAGYELPDWTPDHAVDLTTARPLAWHTGVRRALDTCFCPACRQIAERGGTDPDQAARSVRVRVEQAVSAETQDAAPDDPIVLQYAAARVADCALWLRRLAETGADHRYHLIHAFETPLPYAPAPLAEIVRVPDCEPAIRCAGIAGWALPVWRPTFAAPAALVRLVSDAVASGVQRFDFEGLDEAPAEAVTWLKQAVRFARRG
jgi:hypothetical protein